MYFFTPIPKMYNFIGFRRADYEIFPKNWFLRKISSKIFTHFLFSAVSPRFWLFLTRFSTLTGVTRRALPEKKYADSPSLIVSELLPILCENFVICRRFLFGLPKIYYKRWKIERGRVRWRTFKSTIRYIGRFFIFKNGRVIKL